MSNEALLALADMAGISPTWIDAFGAPQTVAPEAIRAMLNALGMPSDTDADCEASIAALATERATRPLPPLLTAQVGMPIPLGRHPILRSKPYRVELEDGNVIEGSFSDDPEQALEITPLHTPGYHQLQVGDYQVTLAVAPSRCYSVADAAATLPGTPVTEPRLWGIATQLYSLRRPGDGGIGDFGGLARFVRKAARWSTPKRCCSSTITSCKSLKTTGSSSNACVPMTSLIVPSAKPARISRLAGSGVAPTSKQIS